MTRSYRGATALVTGASKGLGRELALELARRGARVVLLARSEASLLDVAAEIRSRGADLSPEVITGDLASPDGPYEIVRELKERGLTVDLLVNNAGAGSSGPFLARPLGPQLDAVQLNIGGLLALTHEVGRAMAARDSGGIINIGSTVAFQPMPYIASYSATKAFVLSFTEAFAEELRGTGVHVMASHPGFMTTGFYDGTSATAGPKADTPASVAVRTLDDYSRERAVSYPGRAMYRVMTWPARFLPRTLATRIVASFSRRQGMPEVVDVA